jgi:hypothetical protein
MTDAGQGDAAATAVVDELVRLDFEVDPVATLGELQHGRGDPTVRFENGVVWRAARTAAGPATIRLSRGPGGWRVMGWGPGAKAALAGVPRLLGAEDDPSALVLPPGRLRDLARAAGAPIRCGPRCCRRCAARR